MIKLIIWLFVLVPVFIKSCTPFWYLIQDPIDYNDRVIDQYNLVVDAYIDYDTYYIETSSQFFDKVEERRLLAVEFIKWQITEFGLIWDFKSDRSLINAAIIASEWYIRVLETHDKDLLNLWAAYINDEVTEEQYYTQNEEIIKVAENDLLALAEDFESAQKAFAIEHDYEIMEDDETY